jgi:hypothetical protein
MSTYGTGRPPNTRDTLHAVNGVPKFLGVLVSAGAAVNNATTAAPFLATPSPGTMKGTLAGRTLLIQSSAAGFVLTGESPALTVANQTLPTPVGREPGVLIPSQAPQIIVMRPDTGWLQWLPSAGAANLFVWELT